MYHALCDFIYACSRLFFFCDCSQKEHRIGGGRVRQVSVQASEHREDHGSGGKWISFVRGSDICHAASEIDGGYAGGGSG